MQKKQKKQKKANVVVFDFDGTLSAYDANYQFARYCLRHSLRTWLFLPMIALGGVGRFLNHPGLWWRQTMRRFLTEKMVKKYAPDFIKQHKLNRFGWAAERVAAERTAGNMVIIDFPGGHSSEIKVRYRPEDPNVIVGIVRSGDKVYILEGPVCRSGSKWWKINSDTQKIVGWIPEKMASKPIIRLK